MTENCNVIHDLLDQVLHQVLHHVLDQILHELLLIDIGHQTRWSLDKKPDAKPGTRPGRAVDIY